MITAADILAAMGWWGRVCAVEGDDAPVGSARTLGWGLHSVERAGLDCSTYVWASVCIWSVLCFIFSEWMAVCTSGVSPVAAPAHVVTSAVKRPCSEAGLGSDGPANVVFATPGSVLIGSHSTTTAIHVMGIVDSVCTGVSAYSVCLAELSVELMASRPIEAGSSLGMVTEPALSCEVDKDDFDCFLML